MRYSGADQLPTADDFLTGRVPKFGIRAVKSLYRLHNSLVHTVHKLPYPITLSARLGVLGFLGIRCLVSKDIKDPRIDEEKWETTPFPSYRHASKMPHRAIDLSNFRTLNRFVFLGKTLGLARRIRTHLG